MALLAILCALERSNLCQQCSHFNLHLHVSESVHLLLESFPSRMCFDLNAACLHFSSISSRQPTASLLTKAATVLAHVVGLKGLREGSKVVSNRLQHHACNVCVYSRLNCVCIHNCNVCAFTVCNAVQIETGEPICWLSSANLMEVAPTYHIARFLPSIKDSKAPFTYALQV